MAKRYYKSLKIIGRFFCMYNTSLTGTFTLYHYDSKLYFKPCKTAKLAQTISGVTNLVYCKPVQFGIITGYQEATN